MPAIPTSILMSARLEQDVPKNYMVPDIESLNYFGRGLSQAQMLALQGVSRWPKALASVQADISTLISKKSHTRRYAGDTWKAIRETRSTSRG